MMSIACKIIALLLLFGSISISVAAAQTTIKGRMLSVDGRTIPETLISVSRENPTDMFDRFEDQSAESDGTYKITIQEPGIYNVTFKGIYHRSITIPFLIVHQDDIEMDLLLLPNVYNDGRFFGNEEYLQWIRVFGNFNSYDYSNGIPFSLNADGSISAFIPVAADTVRYQVRGLGYGRAGAMPLPLADEYGTREDKTFESVIYHNLPPDSIEVRYVPGETIPFQRVIPADTDHEWLNASALISFKNSTDRYWAEPIVLIRYFRRIIPIIERDLKTGLSDAEYVVYLKRFYLPDNTADHLTESIERIKKEASNPSLHPEQRAVLTLGYAAAHYRLEMYQRMLQRNQLSIRDMLNAGTRGDTVSDTELIDHIAIDTELILKIPDLIVPTHPVWNRAQMLPQYLLNSTDTNPVFLDYFLEVVKHHPDENVIQHMLGALIRKQAQNYKTVEEMNVYKAIIERFGERELARRAHEIFRSANNREW